MPPVFYLSLFFLLIYICLCLKPGIIKGSYQIFTGIIYVIFAVMFLIFVYQSYGSILYTALALIGLYIFMYVIQIILGSIKHYYSKN